MSFEEPILEAESPQESLQVPDAHGSVWEKLREQHAEVSAERDHLFVADPVHDGVVLEYRFVPLQETKRTSERIRKITDVTDQRLAAAVDTILLALVEIHVMDPHGHKPTGRGGEQLFAQPLAPLADEGDPAMRFDERLVDAMGFPPGTKEKARLIVRHWFARNDYLLIQHAEEISEWIAGVGNTVREDFAEDIEKGR